MEVLQKPTTTINDCLWTNLDVLHSQLVTCIPEDPPLSDPQLHFMSWEQSHDVRGNEKELLRTNSTFFKLPAHEGPHIIGKGACPQHMGRSLFSLRVEHIEGLLSDMPLM